jgi:hypothetical protein
VTVRRQLAFLDGLLSFRPPFSEPSAFSCLFPCQLAGSDAAPGSILAISAKGGRVGGGANHVVIFSILKFLAFPFFFFYLFLLDLKSNFKSV